MRFEEMAQEMVEATSRLVSGRTINLMDTGGIIIASTEHSRIGTFHQGAAEAAASRKPVAIRKEDVAQYPGAKEGCNVPVFGNDSQIIGVVGIYGDPELVDGAANLLAVYTAQYFAQLAANEQRLVETELRGKLLRLLLSLGEAERENIATLSQALHIRMAYPLRVLVARLQTPKDVISTLRMFEPALERLLGLGLLSIQTDVWSVVDEHLVILKSRLGDDGAILRRIREVLAENAAFPPLLCAGGVCEKMEQIHDSYEEAHTLSGIGGEILNDILKTDCRFRYLMHSVSSAQRAYLETLCVRLETAFGGKDLDIMLNTCQVYYEQACSVAKAAELLHIHKNTLQYRIHRVWEALEIQDCSAFQKEFFLRLCIWHYGHGCMPGPEAFHNPELFLRR